MESPDTVSVPLTYYCDWMRHLVCVPYSTANLHCMARELRIARSWFRNSKNHPHYDIPKRRIAEILARCTVVSPREILKIMRGTFPAM